MARKPFAVYSITKHGLPIAERLLRELPGAELFTLKKFADRAPPASKILPQPFSNYIGEVWTEYDCHIFLVSVGAVVRMIAPHLRDKKVDPAILCIDDKASFTISLLSGHVGKANLYTKNIAKILNNTPVITTASDVQDTLTVDILGREFGWILQDQKHNITAGCAAVVNEEEVQIHQESGEADFWPSEKPWPPGVSYHYGEFDPSKLAASMNLIVSDRQIFQIFPEVRPRSILFHPKSLVVGLGCDKDTPMAVLHQSLMDTCREFALAPESIAALATIDIKAKEQGVRELAQLLQVPLHSYSARELDNTPGVQSPSVIVKKYVGTDSVGEAAALITSKTDSLLVPKQKHYDAETGKNVTIAICRKNYPRRS